MTDTGERLEAVRAAGQCGLDLLEYETPPVSRYTPDADDGKPVLEEDDRYWSSWTAIRDRIDDFASRSFHEADVEVSEERDEDIPTMSAVGYHYIDEEPFASVGVIYWADGDVLLNIGFRIEGGWNASINARRDNLTALDVGRKIGAAELAVLANELQSPAETLDYWMTDTLYAGSQSAWAADRQASRQTVSDRVRSAREKLGEEEA